MFAKGKRGQLCLMLLSDGVRRGLSIEFIQNKPADDFEQSMSMKSRECESDT